MNAAVYQFQAFVKKHGGAPMRMSDCVRLLPDGAMIRDDMTGVYTYLEPPADEFARWTLQRDYVAEHLKFVEEQFQKLRAAILGRGHAYTWPESALLPKPVDPADEERTVRDVQSLVFTLRHRLEQLDDAIAEVDPRRQEEIRRQQSLDAYNHETEVARIRREQAIEAIDI